MKVIHLSRGEQALVDDDDFERVNAHKWHKMNIGSAQARIGKKRVQMHRFIMNAEPGQWVDHINHDRLDNRKSNLRFVTAVQNSANRRGFSSLGYKGVYDQEARKGYKAPGRRYKETRKRYHAQFRGKSLGLFDCPIEAAKAYDAAAVAYYGEYACVNFPKEFKKISKNITTAVDFP